MEELLLSLAGVFLVKNLLKKPSDVSTPIVTVPENLLPPNRRSAKGAPCSIGKTPVTPQQIRKCNEENQMRPAWKFSQVPVFYTKVPLSPQAANVWLTLDPLFKELYTLNALIKSNQWIVDNSPTRDSGVLGAESYIRIYKQERIDLVDQINAIADSFSPIEQSYISAAKGFFGNEAVQEAYQRRKNKIFSGVWPQNNESELPPFPMDLDLITDTEIVSTDTGNVLPG